MGKSLGVNTKCKDSFSHVKLLLNVLIKSYLSFWLEMPTTLIPNAFVALARCSKELFVLDTGLLDVILLVVGRTWHRDWETLPKSVKLKKKKILFKTRKIQKLRI